MKKLIVRKVFAYALLFAFLTSSIFLASCKNAVDGDVGSGGGGGGTPTSAGNTPSQQQQPQTLTFTFNDDSGKVLGSTTTQDASIKFSAIKTNGNIQNPTPANTGDTFVGWVYGTSNIMADDNDDFTVSTTFTAKFTAQGQPAPQYQTLTFTFTAANATPSPQSVPKQVEQGKSINFSDILSSVTTPVKTGYTFIGWFYGNNNGTKAENTTSFSSNTQFTAKFEHTLRFTFTADGATTYASQTASKTVEAGITFAEIKTAGNIQNPTKANHSFEGWLDSTSTTTTVSDTKNFTADQIFTAKFISVAGNSDGRGLTDKRTEAEKQANKGVVYKKNDGGFIVGTEDDAINAGGTILGYIYQTDADGAVHVISDNVHANARWSAQNNSSAVYIGYLGGNSTTAQIPAGKALLSDAVQGAENGFDAWQKIAKWHPGATFSNYNAIATAIVEKRGGNIPSGSATDMAVTNLITGSGVDDRWYLPTVAELQTLYANKDKLPATIKDKLTGDFWSCELPANPARDINVEKTAKYVTFNGASATEGTADKYEQKKVIAVTLYMVK